MNARRKGKSERVRVCGCQPPWCQEITPVQRKPFSFCHCVTDTQAHTHTHVLFVIATVRLEHKESSREGHREAYWVDWWKWTGGSLHSLPPFVHSHEILSFFLYWFLCILYVLGITVWLQGHLFGKAEEKHSAFSKNIVKVLLNLKKKIASATTASALWPQVQFLPYISQCAMFTVDRNLIWIFCIKAAVWWNCHSRQLHMRRIIFEKIMFLLCLKVFVLAFAKIHHGWTKTTNQSCQRSLEPSCNHVNHSSWTAAKLLKQAALIKYESRLRYCIAYFLPYIFSETCFSVLFSCKRRTFVSSQNQAPPTGHS